jgi:dTDP-L-rhamnose 4-epimerase
VSDLVLLTGGAGFVGSHTATRLLELGYRVRVLDSLLSQVHGAPPRPRLAPEVELRVGDVRDPAALRSALKDVRFVFHLAAETATGQSMVEVDRYVDANVRGAAGLWEAVARNAEVEHVVLASSRAVYGEGRHVCARCGPVFPGARDEARLRERAWQHVCPACGAETQPTATAEDDPRRPVSVYALTKQGQEDISLFMADRLGVALVVLRYFNVYGPGQSPLNPYTGLLVTLWGRILAGKPLVLYEDGTPLRDFVHVRDVVDANVAALEPGRPAGTVFNVGSGRAVSLSELAAILERTAGRPVGVERGSRPASTSTRVWASCASGSCSRAWSTARTRWRPSCARWAFSASRRRPHEVLHHRHAQLPRACSRSRRVGRRAPSRRAARGARHRRRGPPRRPGP